MTEQRQVTVTYSKQVSDGNYGNESVEVTLEEFLDDQGDPSAVAKALLAEARALVYHKLDESTNWNVRRALRPKEESDD